MFDKLMSGLLRRAERSATDRAAAALRDAREQLRSLVHACGQHGIEHRLTKPRHPRTNGQVERMSRIIKDATVRRCHT